MVLFSLSTMATVRFDAETGKYFLDWYEDGSRRRFFTGTDEKHSQRELTKLKARLLMRKMGFVEGVSAEAESSSSQDRLPKTKVEVAIQKYLEYSQNHHSPKNYQNTAYILNGLFLAFLKRKRIHYLHQITPETIENYKASRLKGEFGIKKIKPTTVNRQVNILKPMFKKLAEWGYLKANPLEKVANIRVVEEEKGRCLSQKECQKLLEATRNRNGGNFYYLVATALGTGLRRGELKNLKVEDVNLRKREISVVNRGSEARTKTGKNRIVDLSEDLVRILSRYKPSGESMFDFINFRRNWEKTKKLSGVTCRFHDLRHTFITICLQKGIQPTSVADWVGHSDLRMIMKIYKHLQREHLKKEVNKLNGFYH